MLTKTIVLKSSDGVTFTIDEAIAGQMMTIPQVKDDRSNEGIRVRNVESKILAKVIEYCKKHHADDANPSSEEDLKKWDEQFIEIDSSTLLDLDSAAEYLNIKSLSDLTNQAITDIIRSKHLRE